MIYLGSLKPGILHPYTASENVIVAPRDGKFHSHIASENLLVSPLEGKFKTTIFAVVV